MKIMSSKATVQGGASILLFHCVYNGSDSITHFMQDMHPEIYNELPNLYSVCVADNSTGNKKITATFFIKTTRHHNDPDFLDSLLSIMALSPDLLAHWKEKTSLIPAHHLVNGPPLSENEYVHFSQKLYMKHNIDGRA